MSNEPSPSMFGATDRYAAQFSDAILLVARILLGWLFFYNGYAKIGAGMAGFVGYLTSLGVPNPGFWAWPGMLAELIIGIGLILGIGTRFVSLFTVVYLIIATWLAHRYWTYPAAQAGNQFNHFLKNLAMMGGALGLFVTGAGRFSLDAMMRNR